MSEEITRPMPKRLARKFEELPKDWKQIFYDHAVEGDSDISMYTSVNLKRSYHESLFKANEEYREWFEYCHEVSCAWWEDFGKQIARKKDYNSATYSLIMRNRLGWTSQDKTPPVREADESAPDRPAASANSFKNTLQVKQ